MNYYLETAKLNLLNLLLVYDLYDKDEEQSGLNVIYDDANPETGNKDFQNAIGGKEKKAESQLL